MDLSTRYLGMNLRTPLVPAASPLSDSVDNIKRMEDAGASAVVLHSLFEEQLVREQEAIDYHLQHGTESFAESLTYFPASEPFRIGPEGYLERIRKAKETVGIPVIASLNGASIGGWTGYARKIQQAGADALVLFNRFYQPDMDLESLEIRPNVLLSTPQALRLPLRWVAILFGRIKADLAASSGIHSSLDVLKVLMAGANITQLCSVLLQHGIGQIRTIEKGMAEWMEAHEYESVSQLRGSMSQKNCADPSAFERAQYMRAILSYQARA